jgi:hypothetical protein
MGVCVVWAFPARATRKQRTLPCEQGFLDIHLNPQSLWGYPQEHLPATGHLYKAEVGAGFHLGTTPGTEDTSRRTHPWYCSTYTISIYRILIRFKRTRASAYFEVLVSNPSINVILTLSPFKPLSS